MWQHPITSVQVRRLQMRSLQLCSSWVAHPGWVKGGSSLGILRHFQVNQLEAWGYKVLPTVEKTLVCGDKGLGAMAEVNTIVDEVKSQVSLNAQKNQASS